MTRSYLLTRSFAPGGPRPNLAHLTNSEAAAMTEPWEQNACFTIKAPSEDECREIAEKLERYAKRIGAGALFCDYSGPQPEDGPHRSASREEHHGD